MALGGGKWLFQNKILPGSYINVASGKLASPRLSDRGVAGIPIELSWGVDDKLFKVEANQLMTDSKEIFGYEYTADELVFVREIFENATTVYFYKLNSGEKASNEIAEAKYSGTRGNDIRIAITKDLDTDKFKVETMLGEAVVDVQLVDKSEELEDNDYVIFKSVELEETAGVNLKGGTNGKVDTESHQKFLDKIASVPVNMIGCPSDDELIKKLYAKFTERQRDEVGAYFQTVVYDDENTYDYEGIIAIPNKSSVKDYGAVYYYTGALAGVAVNKSVANDVYTGELDIEVIEDQTDLELALENGLFALHEVDGTVRVLNDINTFVSYTPTKTDDFSLNQTVRVYDGLGLEMAKIFNNQYNGHVPNDKDGRISLWSDFVSINSQYEDIRAIQEVNTEDIKVFEGKHVGAVGVINPIKISNVMTHMYATIIIK